MQRQHRNPRDKGVTMRFARSFLLPILVLSLSITALAQTIDPSEILKTADEMVKTVAGIRGLEPKKPIAKGIKSREDIAKFLNQRIQEEYGESGLDREGKLLKKLGLIPADMKYREFMLKLLGEQVEGFYDPEKKTFYLASWTPAAEQKPVMAHELNHALQDQYFNIGKIMKEDRALQNDDQALAHQAVWEGDSMAVMLMFLSRRTFDKLPDLKAVKDLMLNMSSQLEVFASAPKYIQETLLFSYSYGTSFLQKVWAANPAWQSINAIYSDMPASTEQIMHPEKYLDRDNPKPVQGDNFVAKLGKDWKVVYKNVLGEFTLNLLLNEKFTDQRARRSVLGWGGDQVLLLENKNGDCAAYVGTIWDSMNEADVFFQAMEDWFQQSYPQARKLNESSTGFSLVQDGEYHSLLRDGTSVHFIVGLSEKDGMKLIEGNSNERP
jgi:hypothetical protein